MAQITADRVKETSTTTGTGSYSLAGAVSGFRAFSSVCANTDTVYYAAVGGTDWEVGLGTWATGNTLARTTILASSNAGAAVDWIAGTREVFLTHPARAATVNVQEFGGPSTSGTSTWTKPAGAKLVHIIAHGAGGGGGSGRRRNVGEAVRCSGGAGGGGGGRTEVWVNASSLNATETVVVGVGGNGGAAVLTDNTVGNPGSAGTESYVGDPTYILIARFGALGSGGALGTASGGFAGGGPVESPTSSGNLYTAIGGNGPLGAAGSLGQRGGTRGGGGGGGAGHETAGSTFGVGAEGGQGGALLSFVVGNQTVNTGGGGAGGTTDGASGSAGNDSGNPFFGGSGGGGGANSTSTTAGSGGNGGWPGGGGGGGGASVAGQNSGAGGNGANGFVRITTYF